MSTPEDQIDTDSQSQSAQPQSALDALQSPDLKKQASAYADNYFKQQLSGENTRGEASIFQQEDQDAEDARTALRQAREKLAAQRLDPSILGLRFAQAMLAPSRYGVPSQWSNAAGAVADWRQQNQQFQQNQDTQDLSLQQQLSNVDQQSLKARLALEELKQRTGAQTADTALKIAAKPDTPPSHYSLAEHDVTGPDGKPAKQMFMLDSTTGKVTPYGTPAHTGAAAGVGDLPPELQKAVDEHRLNPALLNSRNLPIYSQLAVNNPLFNFNQANADASLQKNPTFAQRAISLESLPEVMTTMTTLGKKVGYDDVKFVGQAQKWLRGETNDPDLTEYMTVRNDALMNIASTMRGVGMSDKAHEAEIEAAAPTMSPKALDAWFHGQMSVLTPRLKRTQRVSHLGDPAYSGSNGTAQAPADPLGIR
jgi:hypothetical protein